MRGVGVIAAVACALAGALLAPAAARAHAFLVKASPAPGSIVATAPREVRLVFSEAVQPAPGTKVLRAGGVSVVAGKPHVAAGAPNEIVIPLRPGIGAAAYAVTWSQVDLEDGHVISGAFVFSVGRGFLPAQTRAAQGTNGPRLSAVVSRWVLLVGLLAAAGSVAFWLAVWRPVLRRDGPIDVVLAAALAVATAGSLLSLLFEPGGSATRYGRWLVAGACVAGVGAVAALASRRFAWLRVPAAAAAVILLGLPTATAHAAAAGVTRAVTVPADIVHLASVAVWLAGVAWLAVAPQRSQLVRRFTPLAIGSVLVLGATGIIRAFNELTAVDKVWTTGYGQALLVKTGVFAAVLALAWFNRRGLPWLRVGLGAGLLLLAVVIGAVAVLTNLRPGRATASATPRAAHATNTVVLAGQDRDLAVGVAVTPKNGRAVAVRTTLLGLDGPASGLEVHVAVSGGGTLQQGDATACGAGCYDATLPVEGRPDSLSVRVAGRGRSPATLEFAPPAQWPSPSAADIVARATGAINRLKTLVVRSRLASDPEHEVTTVYKMVAPDRLSYHNVGGSDSVIIGNKRWDRQHPGGRWVESPQQPAIQQPAPFWPSEVTDAHVLRMDEVDGHPVWVVSFLDPGTPAWFTAWIDRANYRTLRLNMVAAAHFMHDVGGPFDAPLTIEPPRG